jgi:hypothetical protein
MLHKLHIVMVLSVAIVFAAGEPALSLAQNVRSVVGVDSFVSTTDNLDATAVADAAVSGTIEIQSESQRLSFGADFVDRESMIGSPARRELHTLFATVKFGSLQRLAIAQSQASESAALAVAVTVGRFRVPGGFWMIADGGMLQIGDSTRQSLSLSAGSRAFSNARRDLHLNSAPVVLPLLAGSAQIRRDRVSALVSYIFTQDQLELPVTGGASIVRTPDQYIDGTLSANAAASKLFFDGGFSIGTRYLVAPESPDAVRSSFALASQTGYGGATLKLPEWRFGLAVTASRSKVNRASADAAPGYEALGGSFIDQSARIGWHANQWSVDTRYRTRWRPELDLGHRGTLDVRWSSRPWELAAGVGYAKQPARMDVALPGSKSVLARASAGFRTSSLQTSVGAVAQSDLSDRQVVDSPDNVDTALNLFTLQNKNYVFGKLYWQRADWLLGADVEATPTFDHLRAFVQIIWGHG